MTQTKKGLGDPFERPAPTIIGKKRTEPDSHNTTITQSDKDSEMIRTNIYIPRSLKKWLKKYAADEDEDMSGVIIRLLEELRAKKEQ